MAHVTETEVTELATLARLALDADERATLRIELQQILTAMDVLAQVDTSAVAPMTHAVPMDLRLRPDDVAASLPVPVALAAAPQHRDDHFVVPAAISPTP